MINNQYQKKNDQLYFINEQKSDRNLSLFTTSAVSSAQFNIYNSLNSMSSLPQLMRGVNEHVERTTATSSRSLQHHQDSQSAELSDLKRLVESNFLNLVNFSTNRSNSDPYNMPIGSKSKVSFQTITKKYFTFEILESFFGDVTTQTCKMIRYVVFYYLIVYLLTIFLVFHIQVNRLIKQVITIVSMKRLSVTIILSTLLRLVSISNLCSQNKSPQWIIT